MVKGVKSEQSLVVLNAQSKVSSQTFQLVFKCVRWETEACRTVCNSVRCPRVSLLELKDIGLPEGLQETLCPLKRKGVSCLSRIRRPSMPLSNGYSVKGSEVGCARSSEDVSIPVETPPRAGDSESLAHLSGTKEGFLTIVSWHSFCQRSL